MTNLKSLLCALMLLVALFAVPACVADDSAAKKTITDGYGRTVTIPTDVKEVLCSGSGCLRYLTYLEGQDLIVGVDSIEKEPQVMDSRGYAHLNPQFKEYPLFGEFRGKDDPEKIIGIAPELIFKTGLTGTGTVASTNAEEGDKLSEKTGIPVVMFPYGSLRDSKEQKEMFDSLRLMGDIIGNKDRAEELITYIEETIIDLKSRTNDIPESEVKTAYIGGINYAGAHGIISTEPAYPPFLWVNVKNAAGKMGTQHADVAKEAIVDWDPEYLFMDVGTLQLDNEGGIGELRSDPALQGLSALKEEKVYGVLPYNFYSTNYENILIDAYFIGKAVYPDRFEDVDIKSKGDEIMTMFLGASPLNKINTQYKDMGLTQISI
ncbi:iron ABC transporter substrate-binding protein [Methanospirillum sp.]|uniref:iron ABC transporter substrate-binding protein n=1 Tax=Methanospirillum sp. TaxID=45200 RepID=UPI0029857E8F|nr:iron ABC transporter substrate-binding protein [Methanospirillum sp.]